MARWMRHICHDVRGAVPVLYMLCYECVQREGFLLPGIHGRAGLWTVWLGVRPWGMHQSLLDKRSCLDWGERMSENSKVQGGGGRGISLERWFGPPLQCQGYLWRVLKQGMTQSDQFVCPEGPFFLRFLNLIKKFMLLGEFPWNIHIIL